MIGTPAKIRPLVGAALGAQPACRMGCAAAAGSLVSSGLAHVFERKLPKVVAHDLVEPHLREHHQSPTASPPKRPGSSRVVLHLGT